MFVTTIIALYIGYSVGIAESCQCIDVTVGVVAGKVTIMKPQYPFKSEILL